jgi:hypothetical protein
VEPDGTIVGSASTLVVLLHPEYAEHTWKEITADGKFLNHNPNGDSLYSAELTVIDTFCVLVMLFRLLLQLRPLKML